MTRGRGGRPSASLQSSMALAFRVRRHHLARRAPRTALVDIVRDVCGVQAQLMSAAEIALWARVRNLTRDDVERALWRDRTLLKTRCMRGTVHLVPAADFPTLQGGVRRTLVVRITERWMARRGVTAAVEAAIDATLEALAGGPLTRADINERVVGRLGSAARQWTEGGWGVVRDRKSYVPSWILGYACQRGLLCFGPNRGAESTFVRLRSWVPTVREVPAEVAEAELLRWYLRAYGPATPHDFVTWSGLAMAHARRIRAAVGEDATEIDVDGSPRVVLRADLDALASGWAGVPVVRLLPSFDPYLLGHRDKGHLVAAAHYKRVYRSQGWLSPVVLVNGRAVGVWSYRRKGERLHMDIDPFEKVSRAVRSDIEAEAADLGRFLGAVGEVTFS